MAKNEPSVYIANETFTCELEEGRPLSFVKGVTRVAADHPVRKANALYFDVVDADHVHYSAEAATAAPGEKRGE